MRSMVRAKAYRGRRGNVGLQVGLLLLLRLVLLLRLLHGRLRLSHDQLRRRLRLHHSLDL